MTIQHTPGPWHAQQVGTPGYFVINQASGIPVPAAGPKGEVNVRLMAASPCLAAALLRCYTFLNDNFEDYDMPDILGPAREALGAAGLLPPPTIAPADQWTPEDIERIKARKADPLELMRAAFTPDTTRACEPRCEAPDLYDPEDAADELACMREAASDRPVDDDEPDPTEGCAHDWNYTGTQYGGDDERFHGEGRVICRKCGADGDA